MTDPTQITELRGAALAQAVCEYITAHPKEWDQGQWGIQNGCDTTACIAGTAVLITQTFAFDRFGLLYPVDSRYAPDDDPYGEYSYTVSMAARDLLKLKDTGLFYWNPQSDYDNEIGFEEEYDENTDEWTTGPEAPLDFKLRSLWQRVSEEYPGQINIPEEYRV